MSHVWWIDVETANTWSSSQSLNVAVIQGALTYLKQHTSKAVGVYSTGYQWGVITGGVHLGAPVWAAGASSAASAPSSCGTGFTDVTPSASTWCFATEADRAWWGGMWADRILDSAMARQAIEQGLADRADLTAISAAWQAWAAHPDGWIALLHGEILARA